jgi:hypothetical protein
VLGAQGDTCTDCVVSTLLPCCSVSQLIAEVAYHMDPKFREGFVSGAPSSQRSSNSDLGRTALGAQSEGEDRPLRETMS